MSEKIRLYSALEPPTTYCWATDWTVIDERVADLDKTVYIDDIDWLIKDNAYDLIDDLKSLEEGETKYFKIGDEIVSGYKKENNVISAWDLASNDWYDHDFSEILTLYKHAYGMAFQENGKSYLVSIVEAVDELKPSIGGKSYAIYAEEIRSDKLREYTTTPPTSSSTTSEKIRLYSTFEPSFGFGWASDWTVIDNAIAEMTGSGTKQLLLDDIDWFIADGATDYIAIGNALNDGESVTWEYNGEIISGVKKENGQLYEWILSSSGNDSYGHWDDEPSEFYQMIEHYSGLMFRQDDKNYAVSIIELTDEVAPTIGSKYVTLISGIPEDEMKYYTTTPPTPSSNPSNTEEEEPNDPVNDDYFFEPIEDVADLRDTFWQDGHHKDLIITDGVVTVVNGALSVGTHEVYITNSELHSESFQLDEAICQDEDLNFGEASASCIHFKFSGDIIALKGKQLRVYMYLDNNPNTLFQLGIYKVESDIPTADRLSRDVTAYDALYDVVSADVASWYKGISFPVTLRAFFTSFMNKFGIAIDNNADLINANMVVRRTVDPDTLSGKDVLTACLQAFGCFGRIGRNGHFQFVYLRRGIRGLYPRVDLYPKDTLYPREALGVAIGKSYYIPPCQYEDYLVSEIDKLEIRDDDNSIGTTVGSGNNAFVVSGNFLFYGMSETDRLVYATAIYNRITGIVYRPYSTDMLGNPSIQCGDVIRLNTSYTTVEAYVLKRSLKGIQALRDTISADGQQTRSDNVNSLSTRLKNVETKTTAEIKTLSDSLGLYVTKEGVVGDLNSKMSSSIVIQPEKIEITSDGSLIITTSQFKLDANGNATFGGTVSGGKLTQTDSSNGKVEIQNGVITSSNTASSQTATINNANVTITNSSTGHSTSLNAGGITIMNGSTIALNITPSQAKINGYNIITTKNIGSQSVSYASTANSASYLSSRLDTYDGLSANVDGAATDEALINIGSVYKAVTPRYFNHHEANTGSDRKLKTDIKEMDKRYLDLLDLLKVKNFRFKSDLDNVRCGLIAQEVESALADLNIEDSNLVISNNYDTETYLGVNYVQLLTILIPAYQQLKKQHETLVNALKEKGVIE